jgi:general secretion pathway protein A
MYLEFFKLQKMPFRLAPDPSFLYWSSGHIVALARIRAHLARQSGTLALIGSKGVGKSTVLEYLAREYKASSPIRIAVPPTSIQSLAALLATTETQQATTETPIILCDNAHLLVPQTLSRLLQRARPGQGTQPLRLILAGEPDLATALSDAAVSRVNSGQTERCELPNLSSAEIASYVSHRLAMAGLPESTIFDADICAEIHRETRGNPRLVNALCDAAMTLACERELLRVGVAEIRRGLEDIASLARAHESREREVAPVEDVVAPEQGAAPGTGTRALGRLQVLHQGHLLEERELTRGVLRVGRGIDNDLRLDGRYISRNHCRVVTNPRMSLLEDVRSTNGLFVNERRVRNHRLRDGDVIQLGEHQLRYADYRSDKDDDG